MSGGGGCPFGGGRRLPDDGTPLRPSPQLAQWREEAPATRLEFSDGHTGWIVTEWELGRAVLSDGRFSQLPQRVPGPVATLGADPLDEQARAALAAANLLALDGETHVRLRRALSPRLSVRSARGRREEVAAIVRDALDAMRATGSPVDLTETFARTIAARVHARLLGIPDDDVDRYRELFDREADAQARFDFARDVLAHARSQPGENIATDLLAADLSPAEIEGLLFVVLTSGRDSVGYMIATTVVALLERPELWSAVVRDPDRIAAAIEEFMRFGTMFLTLFPRTPADAVDIEGREFPGGETVVVSAVAANRDPARFPDPDVLDLDRDATGHLAFGFGPHGCLGQQLARVEIVEALTGLVGEFPDLRLVDAEQSAPMPLAHPVGSYAAGRVVVAWGG